MHYHTLYEKDGVPTRAVLGFINMINKLIENHFNDGRATHLAIIFDKGSKTFEIEHKEYKSK